MHGQRPDLRRDNEDSMKAYTTQVLTHFGCTCREHDEVVFVELTPELAEYFGTSTLHLVFQPEHVQPHTQLVTHGSYMASRLYDLLKPVGTHVAVKAPEQQAGARTLPLRGINGMLVHRRIHQIHKTEVYLMFRITYYSDEKTEEIITIRQDYEGRLHLNALFPHTPANLEDATVSARLPFTRQHAKEVYDHCLQQVEQYAQRQAAAHQEQLAAHLHENISRLEAYYRQMMNEVPALDQNRERSIRQLQDEYEIKVADELNKCRILTSIAPISLCTITVPFRRYRYQWRANGAAVPTGHRVEAFQNLFSGDILYPRCDVCGNPMTQIGLCEIGSHLVCGECLAVCHICGTAICHDCGIEACAECGEAVCTQCSVQCHLCGERYCPEHTLGCQLCREHVCHRCTVQCEVCGKPVGKIHLTECAICHKQACPACMAVCSCCQHEVCQSHITICAFCGQQACAECTFHCAVCGEAFCVHHITECELTGVMVCPRHVGVCHDCSRHVSTEQLQRCDVCGVRVCTECANRCAHCGAAFCEQHVGELMPCPQCGQLLCTLCYSDHVCSGSS